MRFYAGRFIGEWERFPPFRVDIKQSFPVLTGLLFDARQREAFGLCFDRSDGFAVNEEKIIDFIAVFEQRFSNRDATLPIN